MLNWFKKFFSSFETKLRFSKKKKIFFFRFVVYVMISFGSLNAFFSNAVSYLVRVSTSFFLKLGFIFFH